MITIGQEFGLNNRYKIISELGKGGMSFVYKAYDTMLHEDVAIKVLQKKFANDETVKNRFLNEAKLCLTLSHNNIIRVRDINIFEDNYFMVMEYIDGLELKEMKDDFKAKSPLEIYHFLKPILEALLYAHKFTVHRDIKPSNIMVKDENAYLMDFGISKALDNSALENDTIMGGMGTKKYVSPEQTFNANDVDNRSDIYSMGIIFYELLTGLIPKNTAISDVMKPSHYNSQITSAFDNVILKMLEARAENRYKNIQEVIDGFERAIVMDVNSATPMPIFTQKDTNDIGENFVLIEEGNFLRGSGIESKNPIEKPRKKVYLDAFYICKYCVTNYEYNKYLEESGAKKPKDFDYNIEKKPNHPVVNVSYEDALAYCEFMNVSLPSEAQWEKTAKSNNNFIYPWGNDFNNEKANINYVLDDTVCVDHYEIGQTDSCIFNMAGNVWEWCKDDFIEDFYLNDDINNPCANEGHEKKVIRGGAFDFANSAARNSFRFNAHKDAQQNNLGFRVVINGK